MNPGEKAALIAFTVILSPWILGGIIMIIGIIFNALDSLFTSDSDN